MGNAFHFSPAKATLAGITEVEAEFDIRFPDEYRSFLLNFNGGSPAFPCFKIRGITRRLLVVLSVLEEASVLSSRTCNHQFLDLDESLRGYWIAGIVEDVGHLILNCRTGEVIVWDLNSSHGIPDGGFSNSDVVAPSFGIFMNSLGPDQDGTWAPIDWSK